jgi:hypothetical protein
MAVRVRDYRIREFRQPPLRAPRPWSGVIPGATNLFTAELDFGRSCLLNCPHSLSAGTSNGSVYHRIKTRLRCPGVPQLSSRSPRTDLGGACRHPGCLRGAAPAALGGAGLDSVPPRTVDSEDAGELRGVPRPDDEDTRTGTRRARRNRGPRQCCRAGVGTAACGRIHHHRRATPCIPR